MPEERVNHPKHYNAHPSGVECIDLVEHLSFNLGNAIKYLWRAGHKNSYVEDLRKARWYIERERTTLAGRTRRRRRGKLIALMHTFQRAEPNPNISVAVGSCVCMNLGIEPPEDALTRAIVAIDRELEKHE